MTNSDELAAFIRSTAARTRAEMIRTLEREGNRSEAMARAARSQLRRTRRGMAKDQIALRQSEAASRVARIGRILFFLHHGLPADGATETDLQICDELEKRFR